MGLTRIRAEQISDIDYKQAVRVITLSNVTLSGGAPATVDGVNLSAGNRVLVAGQSTGSQNGLYIVQTVGAGSNGTWIRSSDGNADGEIEAGMIVMVTEGDIYKDTQWKLTTNDPIIIGTTALVFEQNSAYAFGNIYANGTAVLADAVGGTVTLSAGDNIAITGNNTSKTVTIGVTGISLNSIANGTSNVTVISSGGDVTVGVGGVSNVAVFNTQGLDVTGNVIGGNVSTAGLVTASGNVTGGNLVTGGLASTNNFVITGNITGNLLPSANITYDLGSDTARWNDLWLANSTIHIGNGQISANTTALILTNPDGSSFDPGGGGQTVGGNLIILTRSSGNVNFAVIAGYLEVVGRTGNISIPLAA